MPLTRTVSLAPTWVRALLASMPLPKRWRNIVRANSIRDTRDLEPGTRLRLPA